MKAKLFLCSLILFMLCPVWAQAVLVKGTNCGFVTEAPVDDPAGSWSACDYKARGVKDAASVTGTVTEIGWWCPNATEEANFEVAIYSHNAGNDRPNVVIGSDVINAKGTGSGWKKATGLNIAITDETIYWIVFQLDNTASTTNTTYRSPFTDGRISTTNDVSTLPDPWSANGVANFYLAVYAVYEEGAPPEAGQVIIIGAKDEENYHNPRFICSDLGR